MMTHYELGDWHLYVTGDLTAAATAAMEQHLYECDLCMERFTACVERQSSSLPVPSGELLERTLGGILPESKPAPAGRRTRPNRSERTRTLRNYFIAAAATIVLMLTGVFNSLFEQVGELQQQAASRESSVSAKIVSDTVTFFDGLQPKK